MKVLGDERFGEQTPKTLFFFFPEIVSFDTDLLRSGAPSYRRGKILAACVVVAWTHPGCSDDTARGKKKTFIFELEQEVVHKATPRRTADINRKHRAGMTLTRPLSSPSMKHYSKEVTNASRDHIVGSLHIFKAIRHLQAALIFTELLQDPFNYCTSNSATQT